MWKNMAEEPKITSVGTKGQIVISQKLKKELQIKPSTMLAVYRRDDKLVVAKLAIPPLGEELKDLFREINEQNKGKKKPKEKRIRKEIKNYKVKKRARKVA
jgi:bifunctional DNA-binding transcriptional regulator/antitoxin component of YhaV-PrlF toxin-antitoxin module